MTAFPAGTILGYPRIGRRRELKRAVEAHWSGALDEAERNVRRSDLAMAARSSPIDSSSNISRTSVVTVVQLPDGVRSRS